MQVNFIHDEEALCLFGTNVEKALTPEQAKRLADHYTALAQIYREIAGIKPIPTASHQRELVKRMGG